MNQLFFQLTRGDETKLIHMWSTMHECHQVQNYISQQLSHLSDQLNMDPTTAYHRQAAAQLKTEISSWYGNFCKLVKDQREYMQAICRWSQLSHILVDDVQRDGCPSSLHSLSQEWLYALDSLPHKMVSEAIKNLLSGIQSIIEQQEQEVRLHKKSDKLEKKLERESTVLAEMEMKSAMSFNCDDADSVLNSKHPFSIKRAKFEVLKKKVGDEKDKYMSSIKVTQAMILNTLQTTLPNVFQALMRFSDAYAQALKNVLDHASLTEAEGSNA
ncbi:hypothetical protein LIER_38045 [Lithospermum erythrorhizon]|uniref:DUF632 domain-containing protein n=1 Tax=Lithospermum erythrorhizon TaxID=34254 RepID=A0AAV3PUJ9_LITER